MQTKLVDRRCGSWRWEANKLAEAQEYTAGDIKNDWSKVQFCKEKWGKIVSE
jgi:hypothetical protein